MLGILEPKAESTPGTVLLVDKGATAASGIKHGHGKVSSRLSRNLVLTEGLLISQNSDIILVPTPTDEPDNVAKLTFTPLMTLLNPAVLWASIFSIWSLIYSEKFTNIRNFLVALRCWCSCCKSNLVK